MLPWGQAAVRIRQIWPSRLLGNNEQPRTGFQLLLFLGKEEQFAQRSWINKDRPLPASGFCSPDDNGPQAPGTSPAMNFLNPHNSPTRSRLLSLVLFRKLSPTQGPGGSAQTPTCCPPRPFAEVTEQELEIRKAVCWFPVAITHQNELSGLKLHKSIVFHVWALKV